MDLAAVHSFCHEAMNTQWEVVIPAKDADAGRARSVAAAVFAEVDRLEGELSRFRPTSDIWRLGLLRAGESTVVDFAAWDCLSLAKAVHLETGGAFDVTLAPLMRLWRNQDGSPRQARPEELAWVRGRMGMDKFDLDPEGLRVTVHADQMSFDLGAVGKGYALDQAVRVLEENGVYAALMSAGESSVLAVGAPPGEESGWLINLDLIPSQTLLLQNTAVSCSGFAVQGAHIMDPRTLTPVPLRHVRSYVEAPTAALSDALSTAFMLMTEKEVAEFCARHPLVRAISGAAGE